jgi:hypothetical protein
MAISYTIIFHFKAFQNIKNWDFWFENVPSGNPKNCENDDMPRSSGATVIKFAS